MTPLAIPTLEQRQAQSVLVALAECRRVNGQLVERYNGNFGAWRTEVLAGKRNNLNPPQPPNQWTPLEQADGFTYEWLNPVLYVCAPRLDIPEDHSVPQVAERGEVDVLSIPGNYHEAGQPATGAWLIAHGAHAAEVGDPKSLWIKVHRATSFGTAKFYARMS